MASTPIGIGNLPSTQRGIPLSKISPAFLHANSTSHTWVFSAFAEIIDNAYDPDVSASELLIDKVDIRNIACLIFLDNGAGMDRDKLHKMLSFGFCEKDIFESSAHQPIGHYGNGFKSGSMRIGTDALVFTRSEQSASIGFLSQTYLSAIKAESVFVPILDYRLPKLERVKSQESRNNLNAILTYSVFKFEEELKAELRALEGSKTGTKIIISNLKRLENKNLELDFSSDPTDIRCPEAHETDMTSVYHRPVEQYTSEYKLSLREYCSILFLKPRMKITIRSQRVKSKLISKSLSQSEQDTYNPSWLTSPVKIIFGFTCEKERSEDYGLMLYHRNRLIKAFERVGYQKQPNDRGVGVVGVAQVDFLQPIHNKQDFKWDEKFNSVMKAFATKLNEYWNEKMNAGNPSSSQPNGNLPDWTWAQCDHCLKWRRLPDSINPESLPEKWYCRYNADGTHNRCDIPEEPEDEDLAVKPRFEKTFKKRQEEQKRLQRQQQMEEETKKKQEMEKQLRRKEEELRVLQHMKQPVVDRRARELEQALAEAQRCIEEQARLMEQMASGTFPSPPPVRKGQQNGSKFLSPAHSAPATLIHNQPTKRKATVESLPTKENKKLCIKTETGEVLAITRNFGDDEEAADQDLSSNADSKKTPAKPKQVAKGAPLRVALPFQSPKTSQHAEKSTEIHGSKGKGKHDSVMAAKPSASSKEKSHKKGSKSKSTSDDVNFIDLTDDDESFSHPAIKPDPDASETNSRQETVQGTMDVKPDKRILDEQMKDSVEESMSCVDQGAAGDLPSQSRPTSDSANKQPNNVSETIESNLETAMAAIRERADKERLGTAALSVDQHQEQAVASGFLTIAASETTPGRDSPQNTSGPPSESDETTSQPTQAAGSVTTESQKCPNVNELSKISQNIDVIASKPSCAGKENSEKSPAIESQSEPSESEDGLVVTNLIEPSERTILTVESRVADVSSEATSEAAVNSAIHPNTGVMQNEEEEIHNIEENIEMVDESLQEVSGEVALNSGNCKLNVNNMKEKSDSCEDKLTGLSGASEKLLRHVEKVSVTMDKSQNDSVSNGDPDVDSSGCSKSINQCSTLANDSGVQTQSKLVMEQSHKSSTTSAENPREQDESQGSAKIGSTKSLMQLPQPETSQASKLSGPEADKTLNGFVNNTGLPFGVDSKAPSDTNESHNNAVGSNKLQNEQTSHLSETVLNHDATKYPTTPSDVSPSQHSPHDTVVFEESIVGDQNVSLSDSEQISLLSTQLAAAGDGVQAIKDRAKRESNKNEATPQTQTTCSVYVQTEIDLTHVNSENTESSDKLRKNVYRLLQLLAPEKDLGDISNIDKLVENMIGEGEQSSESQSLSGTSLE